MRKTIGMLGIMAAALAMGATTSKVAASQVNEANRQMIPGGGGLSYTALRRDRIPVTGGDNDSRRRRKIKATRSGGIHKHFNKKKHGRNLRRKHGRAAK